MALNKNEKRETLTITVFIFVVMQTKKCTFLDNTVNTRNFVNIFNGKEEWYGKRNVDRYTFLTETDFSFQKDPKDVLQKVFLSFLPDS